MEERTLRKSFDIIRRWAAHCPLDITFNAGADENAIAAVESAMDLRFPNDLRDYLALADGEAWNSDGLIGGWLLLPLDAILREWQKMKQLVEEGVLGDNRNMPTPAVKGVWWNTHWIPIVSSGSGHLICIDMDPHTQGHVGQVILFLHDDVRRPLIAPSLRAWFARLAEDLEGGLYEIVEDDDGYRHFNSHALMWSSREAKELYTAPPPPAALADLLDTVGREALQTLLFDPVEPEALDWHLARLSHRVAPAYLPLATDDSGALAVHLWPGRPLANSPFVYIGEDQSQAHYLCNGLPTLPTALWLWMGRYFKTKLPVLRQAVETLAARIPDGRPVPEPLWSLLAEAPGYEPTWWYADCEETTERAWQLAEVGHPFVGVPHLDYRAETETALRSLTRFVREHREPELVSVLLSTHLKAGQPVKREDVLFVLSAEAWRQSDCLMRGRWHVRGEGLCTWDAVLRHLPDREMLASTPFAALIDHPTAYSGEDRAGPLALGEVALAFRERGQQAAALRQFRNALHVAVLALGGYPRELALAAAHACDEIAPNSLAAAVARRSIEIDREAL